MSRHTKKISSILFHKGYSRKENKEILKKIYSFKGKNSVLAIYNPECIGIMNSTKESFEQAIGIKEIFSQKFIDELTNAIVESGIKQVIFSGFAFGWKALAEELNRKAPEIKIKFFWHGAHAMLVQRDEDYFLYSIMELLDRKIGYSVAFAKESMAEFYRLKGYNTCFLPNTVKNISKTSKEQEEKKSGITLGLYSAGNRWEKNTFNQLSAASMIKNAVVDIAPVNELTKSFCKLMGIKIKDENLKYMPRQQLLDRMAENDVNLYVTFTECSPVIPLESLELGVPCITGNNHHYFKDTKLEYYLIVKSEDDINEIKEKIENAIYNKEEIISLYKDWKVEYDKFVQKKLEEFINS